MCSGRKAAVLDTIRRVSRTPPGSESGACAHGGNAGTWESQRSPCRRSEDGVLTINKSPGKGWESSSPPGEPRKTGHERKEENAGYRGTSESEGSREGLLAVVAEHSTDELGCQFGKVGNRDPRDPLKGR